MLHQCISTNTVYIGLKITYEDDTCLLFSDTSWKSVCTKVSTGLNQIIRNLNIKKITIHFDKTVTL